MDLNFQGSNASNGSATWPGTSIGVETYLVSSLYFAIAATSVFGNILVMLAVFTNRRLRTTSNYLLVALAVPDFFQGAVSLPLRLVEVLDPNCDHKSFCRAAIPVSTLFGGTSNLHILLIAIERFIAICWPYFYCSWITTKGAFVGVGATWISMTIFSLLPVMGWGGRKPDDSVTFCRFPAFLTQEYITCLYVFVHVIPIVTVIFLNVYILRASLDHVRRIGAQVVASSFNSQNADGNSDFYPDQSDEVRRRRTEATRQRKATRVVAAVVGSFILLVVPIITIDLVEMLSSAVVPVWMVKIAVLMIYANHCVNVFVYAGFNSDYRKTFRKILTKGINIVRPERN